MAIVRAKDYGPTRNDLRTIRALLDQCECDDHMGQSMEHAFESAIRKLAERGMEVDEQFMMWCRQHEWLAADGMLRLHEDAMVFAIDD